MCHEEVAPDCCLTCGIAQPHSAGHDDARCVTLPVEM